MSTTKRYYAFDSLRAIMMLLGVVIHSAINYSSSNDMTWPLRANESSSVFFFLVDFIHAFRMPIFFLMAGFFGALLFYNKGPKNMLKNRVQRIFLPFITFLVILRPLMSFSFQYCKAIFEGETPVHFFAHLSVVESFIPFNLSHLWFLYYLFIISILVYILFKFLTLNTVSAVDRLFSIVFKNPLYRLSLLTIISISILILFGVRSFGTSVRWLPDIGVLTYFLSFYLIGWFLFRNNEMVSTLKHYDIVITILGVLIFSLKFYYMDRMNMIELQAINSFITCSLTLGITGIFLRFGDFPNRYITYFVLSAYWVYLIHFFIALLISGYINDLELSVYIKFMIVLVSTTFICLSTYHFAVRNTVVGVFLNGKKT